MLNALLFGNDFFANNKIRYNAIDLAIVRPPLQFYSHSKNLCRTKTFRHWFPHLLTTLFREAFTKVIQHYCIIIANSNFQHKPLHILEILTFRHYYTFFCKIMQPSSIFSNSIIIGKYRASLFSLKPAQSRLL